MKVFPKNPPRTFEVGRGKSIQIKDCGQVRLEADEQVTFVTDSGAEYDVARKSWGYYATPSINGRLKQFHFRTALVKSSAGKVYVFLVDQGGEAGLKEYLDVEGHRVICWLDDDRVLEQIEQAVGEESRAR